MQRILANLSSQKTLAAQLQQTLRQAKAASNSVVIRLTTDPTTCQSMTALLNQDMLDATMFFTTLIQLFQTYKRAHHSKLRKTQPEHRHVWQLMYGEFQRFKPVIKPLLKESDYGLVTHWDVWEPVFRHINRQLGKNNLQPGISSVVHIGLFASPAQKQPQMDDKSHPTQSQPQSREESHPSPAPQTQIVSPIVEASANDENIQLELSLMGRLRQFHQSHAVYFKFAKYLLIAGIVGAATIGTGIGIAFVLDLAFNIGALPFALEIIKEVLISVKVLILLAAKELFQLAKKSAPQKLKDHLQTSQAQLNQNEDSLEAGEPSLDYSRNHSPSNSRSV